MRPSLLATSVKVERGGNVPGASSRLQWTAHTVRNNGTPQFPCSIARTTHGHYTFRHFSFHNFNKQLQGFFFLSFFMCHNARKCSRDVEFVSISYTFLHHTGCTTVHRPRPRRLRPADLRAMFIRVWRATPSF